MALRSATAGVYEGSAPVNVAGRVSPRRRLRAVWRAHKAPTVRADCRREPAGEIGAVPVRRALAPGRGPPSALSELNPDAKEVAGATASFLLLATQRSFVPRNAVK